MSIMELKKHLFSFILISCISLLSLHGAIPEGLELADWTYSQLQKNGFSPSKKDLVSTGSDQFPYNISVVFNPVYYAEENNMDQLVSTLIFTVSQKDFFSNRDEIISLLNFAGKQKKNYRIEFGFTTYENSMYSIFFRNFIYTGSECFASSMDNPEECAAVLLTISEEEQNSSEIYTTGLRKSSPLWLTKAVVTAFNDNDVDFILPQKILSLYRSGLIFGDSQMASYFRNNCRCIKIKLGSPAHLKVIEKIISDFSISETSSNDVHYNFYKTPVKKIIWINEKTNILALEFFGILLLLLITSFSFIGKKRIRYKKEFSKTWYMLPLTLTVSLVSLYTGQLLCMVIPFISQTNPVIQLGFKLIISVILSSPLFGLHQHLTKLSMEFVYSYLLNIVSIANIFIFSIADISLFWLFAFEYLIVYLSRYAKALPGLITYTALMLIPFIPYISIITANATDFDMQKLISSTFSINLLISLVLFPFNSMWLRVINRIYSKKTLSQFSIKKLLKVLGFSTLIILSLFVISIIIVSHLYLAKNTVHESIPQIVEKQAEDLELSFSGEDFDNMENALLNIHFKKPAFRCKVEISAENTIPVLDSTYLYSISEETKKVTFSMPDYPPEKLSIDFATEADIYKEIRVEVLFKTEDPFIFEKQVITGIKK